VITVKKELQKLVARLFGKIERSPQVFLAGLVAAFAVEIVVDWNATFYEVNVLRSQLREKAVNYVAILRLAVEDPVAHRDLPRLEQVGRRVLEDDEVSYVRFVGPSGETLVERGVELPRRYPKQIKRDLAGMLDDPAGLRERIAGSRHRDIFQVVTDSEDRAIRFVTGGAISAPATAPAGAEVAYQDRLYDERTRLEDRTVVWALALVERPQTAREPHDTRPAGLVLIALKTDRLRAAVTKKLLKGTAIVSLPRAPPTVPGLEAALAFVQAERLGGTVYDLAAQDGALMLFLACPEGSGVDVAFASVFIRDEERRLHRASPSLAPEALVRDFVAFYRDAPIRRRLDLMALVVDPARGELHGVLAGLAPPILVGEDGAEIAPALEPLALEVEPEVVSPPLRRFRAPFPVGATLLVHEDGLPEAGPHPLARHEALTRAGARRPAAEIVDELAALTVKRSHGALADDLFVLLLRRS
jgi:hypothetical protein